MTDGARHVDRAHAEQAIQRRMLLYDKGGEEHYNIISALHKSMRNSDPDAALYWLARMLEAGEDPLYVARRLVRFASEDVGMADPQALTVAIAAKDAVHFLGMPEGNTALAQAAVYLATAPKSNAIYLAYGRAAGDAQQRSDRTGAAPPAERAHEADEGSRLRTRLRVRARCARRGHRHAFAARLARRDGSTTSRPDAGSRRRSSGGWMGGPRSRRAGSDSCTQLIGHGSGFQLPSSTFGFTLWKLVPVWRYRRIRADFGSRLGTRNTRNPTWNLIRGTPEPYSTQ